MSLAQRVEQLFLFWLNIRLDRIEEELKQLRKKRMETDKAIRS